MFKNSYPVLKKENLAKGIYSLVIRCPEISNITKPGQFVTIAIDGFSLRRPISICEIDKNNETIRLVFEVRGEGTEKLSQINQDDLIDLMAPLGKGFTVSNNPELKKAVIAGGIGVPPMLELCKNYYKQNITSILGFQTAAKVILKEDFEKVTNKTIICTDDGTSGIKGFVTNALENLLQTESLDIIYTCGPYVMMKGIYEIAKKHNISCEVSMEQRMGCGIGACLVCACKVKRNDKEFYAHVCKDGPVFKAEEVIF